MAGKRKSKKSETEDETVRTSEGVQLLLGNMPPSRDVMYHYEMILGLMEKAATAQSKVTDAKKKAKEAGVDVKALMTAKTLMRLDPLDLSSLLRQQAMLMAELGSPIQISLFEPKYGSIEAQATAMGNAAGMAGKSPETDLWPEGTPGHSEYMRAWNTSQKTLVEQMGQDAADNE